TRGLLHGLAPIGTSPVDDAVTGVADCQSACRGGKSPEPYFIASPAGAMLKVTLSASGSSSLERHLPTFRKSPYRYQKLSNVGWTVLSGHGHADLQPSPAGEINGLGNGSAAGVIAPADIRCR